MFHSYPTLSPSPLAGKNKDFWPKKEEKIRDKTKKNKLTLGKILKEIFLVFLFVGVGVTLIVGGGFAYLMASTPLGDTLETREIAQTSVIYDRTGEHVLYKIHGEENRKIVSHDEIPDIMRIATIATEDDAFYHHSGIDFLAIARATKTNLENKSLSQGGSTITQQLARNAFLSRDKTFKRKILEAVYAVKIERKYSKDEILDSYLNEVPYGANAYGIEAAAKTYFGKPATELSLDEAALLASLTKAPSYYSPYSGHTKDLVSRQKDILERIAKLNLANQAEVEKALNTDTLAKVQPHVEPIDAPHFVFYVLDYLEEKYGEDYLRKGGLQVYTSIDYDKQKLAENILKNNKSHLKKYGAENAALVALNPKSGQILSMVGSVDYYDPSIDAEVNVTTRPRQPGSSFKPIVYAKAFEKGFQPETLVLDTRTDFGPDGSGRNYIPQNYSGNFRGIVSMRQALAMSLNIPAIKTLREVGLDDAIEMAHRLGITTLNDRNRYGLSLVIGGGEVTLLDETSAFSVFANDGKRNPISPIFKIKDNKGKIIEENSPKNTRAISEQVARKMNSILSDNEARVSVFGPNNKLFIPGHTVAAKTGTTQEYKDAWTVGYTPDIAVGVWAGNNDSRPMRAGADGSFVAAPIWNQFMSGVINSYPKETFVAYEKADTTPNIKNEVGEVKEKVTYYRNGKKISKDKAKKLDPKKVEKRVEYVYKDSSGKNSSAKKPAF